MTFLWRIVREADGPDLMQPRPPQRHKATKAHKERKTNFLPLGDLSLVRFSVAAVTGQLAITSGKRRFHHRGTDDTEYAQR